MAHVTWTGHPFVDAGLAALAALAGVEGLESLKPEHFEVASQKLQHMFQLPHRGIVECWLQGRRL
ncbi:MAG: hypothetical protein ABDK93_04760 [Atribacterota bacterium]